MLLADHDMESHRTRYVLAQHYFRVPLVEPHNVHAGYDGESNKEADSDSEYNNSELSQSMMRMWYVTQPFEVVCVLDGVDEEGEEGIGQAERPRPLMAVDFGHAVWVEYVDMEEKEGDEGDAKRLCFVSFPPVTSERESPRVTANKEQDKYTEGVVRTLEIPGELDLDTVETINIDQSQGAVIISVREGRIFILCYE